MSQAAPNDVESQTADALHDLRTGINLIDLQQVAARLTERGAPRRWFAYLPDGAKIATVCCQPRVS